MQPNLSAVSSRRLALAYERSGKTAAANGFTNNFSRRLHPRPCSTTLLLGVDLLANRENLKRPLQLITSSVATLGEADRLIAQYRLADLLMASGQPATRRRHCCSIWSSGRHVKPEPCNRCSISHLRLPNRRSWSDGLTSSRSSRVRMARSGDSILRSGCSVRFGSSPSQPVTRPKSPRHGNCKRRFKELRRAWPLGYLLLARLHQLPGAADDALAADAYRHAVQLGDRQVGTFEELLSVRLSAGSNCRCRRLPGIP